MKKHYKDMTSQEIDILQNRINKLLYNNQIKFGCDHLQDLKNIKRNINNSQIIDTLQNGTIIELIKKSSKIRVLVRGKKVYNDSYNVCVVIDIVKGYIITRWKNNIYNTKDNINWSNYSNFNLLPKLRKII